MAVVDAEYSFISIDVGSYGKESDSTIFKNCPFGKKLYAGLLNLPAPVVLPNTDNFPEPLVVIGDEAFGLHKNLLRPYPGRGLTQKRKIFNYRLSRARR
ncbi:protein ALP1-like [Aphis craccivora]|uniref:Protein ALP1-like n=1 Tax=Aphis craccivora TaxID=307492 RepID=A0A6G0WDK7_APHCR|nr:protein ALP1-like [Aphis craccivora]